MQLQAQLPTQVKCNVFPSMILELVHKPLQGRMPAKVITCGGMLQAYAAPEYSFNRILMHVLETGGRQAAGAAETEHFFAAGEVLSAALAGARV